MCGKAGSLCLPLCGGRKAFEINTREGGPGLEEGLCEWGGGLRAEGGVGTVCVRDRRENMHGRERCERWVWGGVPGGRLLHDSTTLSC